MKHISVDSFKEVITSEENNPTVDFINVCTPAEYKEKHIRGVRSVPLDTIEKQISTFNNKKTVYIHCRSGSRGRQAIERLKALGVTAELINVEGGLLAWEEAGHETGSTTTRLPIIRQVFIGAGVLVLIGVILAKFFNINFLFFPLLVSLGLIFSGVSGWCGMAFVLAKMPWNK